MFFPLSVGGALIQSPMSLYHVTDFCSATPTPLRTYFKPKEKCQRSLLCT